MLDFLIMLLQYAWLGIVILTVTIYTFWPLWLVFAVGWLIADKMEWTEVKE